MHAKAQKRIREEYHFIIIFKLERATCIEMMHAKVETPTPCM